MTEANESNKPLGLASTDGLGPLVEPVTLADVLDALNVFNKPRPRDGDEPWTEADFISVKHLPDFINIIAVAWFLPAPLTDQHVDAVVRSVQPNLDARCKAWRELAEQCRYWLETERALRA